MQDLLQQKEIKKEQGLNIVNASLSHFFWCLHFPSLTKHKRVLTWKLSNRLQAWSGQNTLLKKLFMI
jgi:hypothetical protein